jgi:hypothetical protein
MNQEDKTRFWDKVNKHGPYPDPKKYPKLKTRCWLWTGATVCGYGAFRYKGSTVYAHRTSWRIRKGKIKAKLDVCHKCDNRLCVRHLFCGTRKQNIQDCVSKDRNNRGSRNGMTHLTEADVLKIRNMYASGKFYQREIAALYAVTDSLISMIASKRIWRHV